MRPFLLLFLPTCLILTPPFPSMAAAAEAGRGAPAIATPAKQALLVEYPSFRTLLAKNAGYRMRPSSMTKLMTALLLFEALRAGRLSGEDRVAVSRYAAGQRGSRVGLRRGGRYPARDLMLAMIVHSANDATVALAERLAAAKSFAAAMTGAAGSSACAIVVPQRHRFRPPAT